MMNEVLFLVEESAEGGYEARALGELIYTEADDPSSLRQMIADAVGCHFDEKNCPKMIRLHFVS